MEEVLSGCGLFRHAEAFRRERVSWDALMELEEPDLVTLGLSLGHGRPAPPERLPPGHGTWAPTRETPPWRGGDELGAGLRASWAGDGGLGRECVGSRRGAAYRRGAAAVARVRRRVRR